METLDKKIHYYIITIITLSFISGCSLLPKKLSVQQGNQAVWADDGFEVAVVKLDEQSGQYKHQIIIKSPNNPEMSRVVTDWRENQTGQLFYMKQNGYLVVESFLENGARRFDKIDSSNGREILIVETPSSEYQICKDAIVKENAAQVYQTVIPSPDGSQLAHIYSPECGKVTVEFLHANNLSLF